MCESVRQSVSGRIALNQCITSEGSSAPACPYSVKSTKCTTPTCFYNPNKMSMNACK